MSAVKYLAMIFKEFGIMELVEVLAQAPDQELERVYTRLKDE